MSNAILLLRTSNVVRSSEGHVLCGLALQLGNEIFPHPDWSDFAMIVLAWWADAANRMLRGFATSVEVRFMDGPYLVKIRKVSASTWHIQCLDAGLQYRVRTEAVVDPLALVRSVLDASRRLLQACSQHGLVDSDSDELRRQLTLLDQFATQ